MQRRSEHHIADQAWPLLHVEGWCLGQGVWLPCTPCLTSNFFLAKVAGLAYFVLLKAGPAETRRSANGRFARLGAGLWTS